MLAAVSSMTVLVASAMHAVAAGGLGPRASDDVIDRRGEASMGGNVHALGEMIMSSARWQVYESGFRP